MTKREIKGSLISLALAGGLAAFGTEAVVGSDERMIRSLEEQLVTAVREGDIATLERLMSDQYIVNNPQNTITPNREGVLDRVRRGLIRYSSFESKIEAIRIQGDVAIVMGSETVMPIGDAPRAGVTVHRRYTNIWQRSGATWHSIARHANVVQ